MKPFSRLERGFSQVFFLAMSSTLLVLVGFVKKQLRKIYLFFGSLKLAVFVILSLAVVSAIGTFVEARYNAETAQKLVYHSIYMTSIIVLMVINLVCSALQRYPWKKKHVGFLVAHIGLLSIIGGSLLTAQFGVDGSMYLGQGESSRLVSLTDSELSVYLSLDDLNFTGLKRIPVDFLLAPPKKNPLTLKFQNDRIQVLDFYPYAYQKTSVEPSHDSKSYPAARFQLFNDRVNLTDWIEQSNPTAAVMPLGPANIVLTSGSFEPTGANEMVLNPKSDKELAYTVYLHGKKIKTGVLKIADLIDTGWMNLKFRLLNYYPKAKVKVDFVPLEFPTPVTTSAVKVGLNDDPKTEKWIGQGGLAKFVGDGQDYLISYGKKRLDVGFNIRLKKFEVGRYQGTSRAESYASDVEVEGLGDAHISMNEPLVRNGYTFYQASFEENEKGEPSASILAVNRDPGRWFKYAGAILVVLGAILLFYFKGNWPFAINAKKS